jgi:hypothetical protein
LQEEAVLLKEKFMKNDDLELEEELLPEYDLKRLRVKKLGSGRKSFGSEVVRLELDVAEMFPTADAVNEALRLLNQIAQSENQADDNLTVAATKLSEASFSKVWDNHEDAAYNTL